MVLPSANLQSAVPGGLGRLDLSGACAATLKPNASTIPITANDLLRMKPPGGTENVNSTVYNRAMSVFDDRKEELEKHEFMMGPARGRLAVTLDALTDALVLVGQHGVYCQSARQPGKPAMDVQIILKSLNDAKELVSSVLQELKKD